MTGYIPLAKREPPCYGCKHLVRSSDAFAVSYYCTARSKPGREIIRTPIYLLSGKRSQSEKNLDYKIKIHKRPAWCPERKDKTNG